MAKNDKVDVKTEPATKSTGKSEDVNKLTAAQGSPVTANVRGTSDDADAPQTTVPATVDNGTATGEVVDPSPINMPNPAVTNSPVPRTLADMPIPGVGATPRELATMPPAGTGSTAGLTTKEGKVVGDVSYPPLAKPIRDAKGNIITPAVPAEVERARRFKEAGHTKCCHARCHYPLNFVLTADRQQQIIQTDEGPGFLAECSWDPRHKRPDGSEQYILVESTIKNPEDE